MSFIRKWWQKVAVESSWVGRVLLILGVIGVLICAMILSGPRPDPNITPVPTATRTPVPVNVTPIIVHRTPVSSTEYAGTTGVIVAVLTVTLIVIIGTVIELARSTRKTGSKKQMNDENKNPR
jgi:hypothetical protein